MVRQLANGMGFTLEELKPNHLCAQSSAIINFWDHAIKRRGGGGC